MSKAFIGDSSNCDQGHAQLLQEGILVLLIGLVQNANNGEPFPLRVTDILQAAARARGTHIIRFRGDGQDPTQQLRVSVERRPPELSKEELNVDEPQ